MELLKNFFMRSPGGENEGGNSSANVNSDAEKNDDDKTEGEKKEKGFFGKIKEALRDWSVQDQADQEFDDTRV